MADLAPDLGRLSLPGPLGGQFEVPAWPVRVDRFDQGGNDEPAPGECRRHRQTGPGVVAGPQPHGEAATDASICFELVTRVGVVSTHERVAPGPRLAHRQELREGDLR